MNDEEEVDTGSMNQHMVRGSAWMIAMRWCMRAIGLVSTVILARLLTPADFGIVAMAMIVVGFLEVFSSTGVDLALIQGTHLTRDHYDTAWTIEIVQALLLAAIMILIAPYAGAYFDEPRVVPVIRLLSLRAIIGGFQNIGVVAFRKELDFAKEFRFGVFQKLLTLAVTVTLAVLFRTYWALVGGLIVGRVMEVALSYAMHVYRPRFNLRRFRDLWSFSQWVLLSSVGYFLNGKVDSFVVGGIAGAARMGNYSVGSDLATLPTTEIVMPLGRALFPSYSRLKYAPAELGDAFLRVTRVLSSFCFAAGLGTAAVAPDLVTVVLGSQWHDTVPFIRIFAVFGAINSITFSLQPLFTAVGKVRFFALFTWIQLAVLAPALMIANAYGGIIDIALARAGVAIAVAPLALVIASRTIDVPIGQIFDAIWRPLAAGLVMVVAVVSVQSALEAPAFVRLVLCVAVGAAVYSAASLALWMLTGRPDGVERASIDFLSNRLRRAAKT